MAIIQLKDGRWIIQYPNPEKGKPPRLIREYFGRGVEAEAKAIERHKELGINAYTKGVTNRQLAPTFFELGNAYLEARKNHIQPTSLNILIMKLQSIIYPAIGSLCATQLTHSRIDKYVDDRIQAGKKRTTIHRDISDIQAILNWAVKRRLISHNPVAGYEKPKRDDAVVQPPTPAEAKSIIDNASPHLARALTICYYTGLRPGASELLGLTWNDVDLNANTILIRSAQKNGLRSRSIPLHPAFAGLLQEWHQQDQICQDPCNLIIKYKSARVASLKTAYHTAKRKAGITRKLPMYSFRHAFATTLLQHSADLKSTSELLGHSRIDTTLRIYQHTFGQMHIDAIGVLPDIGNISGNTKNRVGNTIVLPENEK